MSPRYLLSSEAASDLFEIWDHIRAAASEAVADRVEPAICERLALLATFREAGHYRRDLTDLDVKFFSVYSYLIVYRPETRPLQIVTILHGH